MFNSKKDYSILENDYIGSDEVFIILQGGTTFIIYQEYPIDKEMQALFQGNYSQCKEWIAEQKRKVFLDRYI